MSYRSYFDVCVAVVFVAVTVGTVWGDPLPINAPAAAKYVKLFNELELKIADEYVARTKDPPELKATGRKLLYEVKQVMLGQPAPRPIAEYQKIATDMIARGSKDPLILAVAVQTQPDLTKKDELVATCHQAMADVVVQYGPREQADVIDRCHNVLFDIANEYRFEKGKYPYPDKNQLGDAYVRWIAAEADNLDAQRRIWMLLDFQFNDQMAYRGDQLVYVAKKSREVKVHPWLRHMLDAFVLMFDGKQLWLNDDEAYKPLYREAGKHYLEAWKIAPQFPQAAAESIQLARGEHVPEKPRVWFERAMKAEFGNDDAFAYYRTHLRNEGSEALLNFGIECAKTERFDTKVPMDLIECLWAIENHSGENGYAMEGAYDAVREMIGKALAAPVFAGQPQTKATRAWLVATQIAVAARAGRFEDLVPLLDQTDSSSLTRATQMHNVGMSLAEIREAADTAVLGGGKLSSEVEKALAAARDEDSLAAVVKKIDAAQEVLGPDHPRVRNWRHATTIYKDLFAGKWAEIKFPPDAAKLSDAKKWTRVDERTLLTRGTEPYPLAFLANVSPPFELSYEIATVDMPPDVEMAGAQIGRVVPQANRREHGVLFGFSSAMNEAAIRGNTLGVPLKMAFRFPVKAKPVNEIRLRVWYGYHEQFVNGERLTSWDNYEFDPTGYIALWAPGGETSTPIVRFSKLRVRQLQFESPPHRTEHDARVEYFTARIADEPEIVEFYRDRGDAYLKVKQPAEALKDFSHLLKTRPESPEALVRVGMAQAALDQFQIAVEHYEQAMKIDPTFHGAFDRLAWLRATANDEKFRDGDKAVELAQQANKLIENRIALYSVTLAAAQAEKGDIAAAKATAEYARDMLFRDDVPSVDAALKTIEAGQPYRDK